MLPTPPLDGQEAQAPQQSPPVRPRSGDDGPQEAKVTAPNNNGERYDPKLHFLNVTTDLAAVKDWRSFKCTAGLEHGLLTRPTFAVSESKKKGAARLAAGDLVFLSAPWSAFGERILPPRLGRNKRLIQAYASAWSAAFEKKPVYFAVARLAAAPRPDPDRCAALFGSGSGAGLGSGSGPGSFLVELDPDSCCWIQMPRLQLEHDLGLRGSPSVETRSAKFYRETERTPFMHYYRTAEQRTAQAAAAARAVAGAAGPSQPRTPVQATEQASEKALAFPPVTDGPFTKCAASTAWSAFDGGKGAVGNITVEGLGQPHARTRGSRTSQRPLTHAAPTIAAAPFPGANAAAAAVANGDNDLRDAGCDVGEDTDDLPPGRKRRRINPPAVATPTTNTGAAGGAAGGDADAHADGNGDQPGPAAPALDLELDPSGGGMPAPELDPDATDLQAEAALRQLLAANLNARREAAAAKARAARLERELEAERGAAAARAAELRQAQEQREAMDVALAVQRSEAERAAEAAAQAGRERERVLRAQVEQVRRRAEEAEGRADAAEREREAARREAAVEAAARREAERRLAAAEAGRQRLAALNERLKEQQAALLDALHGGMLRYERMQQEYRAVEEAEAAVEDAGEEEEQGGEVDMGGEVVEEDGTGVGVVAAARAAAGPEAAAAAVAVQ